MRVGILVFNEVEELDFVGPLEVFGIASTLVPALTVLTVSKDGQPIQARYGLKVQPDYSFHNCPPLELLIVPGGKGAREYARYDKEILAFVKTHAAKQQIASICTGALVLAEAGVLAGKRATTHHSAIATLRLHAQVQVIEEARFVLEDRVSTSAGISAGIDLSLELVNKHFGNTVAAAVAEIMEYNYHRDEAGRSKEKS
ncbi:MAG TPA: DJ-1/PfpI family protein [archaeon]|nr:DJ-1/PfpI family protein [archaeon]